MTRDEILRGVESLNPWWHCIDLGDGIKTKTISVWGEEIDHPAIRWQALQTLIPPDLTGRSVLDVGCNAGFFAVEAKRRGANRVLGIDAQRHEIMQANFVKRVLGLDIEYRQMNVYELNPNELGTFDITLALGLLYHCKHLLMAVEKLYLITNELLIIDSSVISDDYEQNIDFGWGEVKEKVHITGYVSQAAKFRNENHANWFFPTPTCLQSMLLDVGFESAEIALAEGLRAIIVCRKPAGQLDSTSGRGLESRLKLIEGPVRCRAGSEMRFVIAAENTGVATWLASAEGFQRGTVWLGAHLFSETAEVARDYGGVGIGHDLRPGQTFTFEMPLRAPTTPGPYYIEFDMVTELISWFQDLGSKTLLHQIEVTE